MRFKGGKFLLLLMGIGFCLVTWNTASAFDAAKEFELRCSACHSVGAGDKIGPDLKGVSERRKPEWILKFVKSPNSVIKSGDSVAIGLQKKFNQIVMPDQDLSETEILEIIKFIDLGGEGAAGPKPAVQATLEEREAGKKIYLGKQPLSNGGPACVSCHAAGEARPFFGGKGKDLTNIFSLHQDKGLSQILKDSSLPAEHQVYAQKTITDDEGFKLRAFLYVTDRDLEPAQGVHKAYVFLGIVVLGLGMAVFIFRKSRRILLILGVLFVLLVLLVIGEAVVRGLSRVGDNRGYMPVQPIAFSHKIHAGDNKISCFYCHYGVERSRHAGIPADSVCLNCHTNIVKDSPEIAKIKKAVDEKKPIEWLKVHRLADFVYFSHERHVGAGKIQCQTCHGPVETMRRMKQEKSLTMGWCLDCHRTSNVLVHSTQETPKESEIGGQDCAKCHY